MRLGVVPELGQALLGYLPRQEHTAGLAAYRAGAYHPVAHGEVVLRVKELVDEPLHVRVLAHHALEYGQLRLVAELAAAVLQLGLGKEAVVAVVVLVLRVGGDVVQQPVVPADGHAAVQRLERAAVSAHVRDVNVVAVALLRLERVYVHTVVGGVDVYQKLRRVAYARHGVEGVARAQQGEIRHRLQLVEVGTGHAEEVGHHLVCVPGRLQVAQAVKDVERALALGGYAVVYGHGEGLKAHVGVELKYLQSRPGGEQRLVVREVHVHHVPPVGDRPVGKGLGEKPVLGQLGDLPDDVVAHADVVEHLVRPRVSAGYSVK